MNLRVNLSKKEINSKKGEPVTTSLPYAWVVYFNNKKLRNVVIHFDWLTEKVMTYVKMLISNGINVKLEDEYLLKAETFRYIDNSGEFYYSKSDQHSDVWSTLKNWSDENRMYHFQEMEVRSDLSTSRQFLELNFDKKLALRRLKFLAKKYNMYCSKVHDFKVEESLYLNRTRTNMCPVEDVTYLNTNTIEAQIEALTILFQLETPRNKYEALINRAHGLYLLSQYIDPDVEAVTKIKTIPQ